MAKLGTPAGLIGTTAFQGLAVSELTSLGVAGFPLLVIQHPLGGERPESVARRAQQALEQLASLIGRCREPGPRPGYRPRQRGFLEVDDDPQAVLAAFCERRWCDGLPIVPPTEARVRRCWMASPTAR